MQIASDELMRLLIPDGQVERCSKITGLSASLLYQERRPFVSANDTGTRNTIERLDLICELALSKNPNAVRLLGERYRNMYQRSLQSPENIHDQRSP